MVWPVSSRTKSCSSSRATGRQRARSGRSSTALTWNKNRPPGRTTRPISANTERVTLSGNMCKATLDITASKLASGNGSGRATSATRNLTSGPNLSRARAMASADRSIAVTW
jgi:hypothetical protein